MNKIVTVPQLKEQMIKKKIYNIGVINIIKDVEMLVDLYMRKPSAYLSSCTDITLDLGFPEGERLALSHIRFVSKSASPVINLIIKNDAPLEFLSLDHLFVNVDSECVQPYISIQIDCEVRVLEVGDSTFLRNLVINKNVDTLKISESSKVTHLNLQCGKVNHIKVITSSYIGFLNIGMTHIDTLAVERNSCIFMTYCDDGNPQPVKKITMTFKSGFDEFLISRVNKYGWKRGAEVVEIGWDCWGLFTERPTYKKGYKKLKDGRIAELSFRDETVFVVPASGGRKVRANEAYVYDIYKVGGDDKPTRHYLEGHSYYDPEFIYSVGEWVKPTRQFDHTPLEDCGSGIHFYWTRQEAIAHTF